MSTLNVKSGFRYYGFTLLFRVLDFLPLRLLFLLSELITFVIYHLVGYRRKVILENLKNSFPDKEDDEIRWLARKYYRYVSSLIVETIYLRFIPAKALTRRIVLENKAVFDELYAKNKSVILMLGHFGNWEYGVGLSKLLPYRISAVYKKVKNQAFNQIFFELRSRLGAEPVEMKEVMRKMVSLKDNSEPFLFFMVADQSPMRSESSHWLRFLNQETLVFSGAEKLAKKFDLAVVYLEILRKKKGVYRFLPTLITDNPKAEKDGYVTARFFQLLEDSIKKSPRYWLWSHRRWKIKPTEQNV